MSSCRRGEASLRILHVAPYSADAWAYGGIARLAGTLTRGLARRGHHVTFCTTDVCDASSRLQRARPRGATFRAWPPIRTADGVELRVFPNLSNHLAYSYQAFLPLGLNGFLKRHAASFDVAHLHACRNLPGAIAAHHLRRAAVPYVLAPNGTAPRIERHLIAKRIFDLLAGRRMLHAADRVLAVSNVERRQLCELGVAPAAIRLIPNPVDLDDFTPPLARGRLRRRLGLPPGPLVMFLGKLTPRKRVDVLIRAFAQLKRTDAWLVVAGNDMGGGARARALVASLGIAGRTTFTGLLRGHDRLEALADAEVLVYPSQDEIFGLVPLEALLCGTPVVVADDSGCGEVIRTAGGGQVVPLGDPAAFAEAIECVLASPSRWRRAAAKAAEGLKTAYSGEVVCAQLEQLDRRNDRMIEHPAIGVSFVVPVSNGAACVRDTLAAIVSQADGRPLEIIVVDDGSTDGSSELLQHLAAIWPLHVVHGEGRGAAAAINTGVRAARYPVICQVDQDVVVRPGWMPLLAAALENPAVGAAQGYYTTDPRAARCARAMGLDLEQRYAAMSQRETSHVCTGNSAYRASALHAVGLFDETLGYGYDNDMSYRLRNAGYRLAFCPEACSVHRWRSGFTGYLLQQYGFGYGRIDLVAKHPRRVGGDSVSPAAMMLHPLLMAVAVAAALAAWALALADGPWRLAAVAAVSLVGALALERAIAGVRAALRFRDATALLFPVLHLARDLAWVAAMAMWTARLVSRRSRSPFHSMRPRMRSARQGLPTALRQRDASATSVVPARVLGIIPAYNEVASLAAVVAEVRARRPDLDLLVVDDGSTDATPSLLQRLDVQWLRFPERLGIGGAMRAGLRYAARLGYDTAVRIDGDGQHRPDDIDRMLAPLRHGADVVLGSRYLGRPAVGSTPFPKRLLAFCLSMLTGQRVTDPTSGFCAIGPRAMALLAEHHPTGYPEPELRLFLNRNALRVIEVPVGQRPRLGGTTSLTAGRLTAASARVLLAMIIVPLRCRVEGRV